MPIRKKDEPASAWGPNDLEWPCVSTGHVNGQIRTKAACAPTAQAASPLRLVTSLTQITLTEALTAASLGHDDINIEL